MWLPVSAFPSGQPPGTILLTLLLLSNKIKLICRFQAKAFWTFGKWKERKQKRNPLMGDDFGFNPYIDINALLHLPQTWPDNFYSGIWSHLWHFRKIFLGFMMLPQVKILFKKGSWKRKLWSGYAVSHNYGEKLSSKPSFFFWKHSLSSKNKWLIRNAALTLESLVFAIYLQWSSLQNHWGRVIAKAESDKDKSKTSRNSEKRGKKTLDTSLLFLC